MANKKRPLKSLTESEFNTLKESGLLWELYPNAPTTYGGVMEKQKHTPGSWKLGHEKNGDSNTVLGPQGQLIAEWFGEGFHLGSSYKLPSKDEAQANAALIAAAPTMLVALKAVLDMGDEYEAEKLVKEAIALAEGR